jgi:DNA-binding HxlR family transcriptional regulator
VNKGYGQFCPIAMASEILATRWTPLILRELMANQHGFNDIHRGIPLISRALLASRLRELEYHGVVERRRREGDGSHEYWLTQAGEAFRRVLNDLGHWGLVYARDRIRDSDLDPTILLWGLRKRADLNELIKPRIVVRFEFAGIPANRSRFRILWLVLERTGADVCAKDPGHPIDAIFRGDIADFVKVYLGHVPWREMRERKLIIEGERRLVRELPRWLRLDKMLGRDMPIVSPTSFNHRGGPETSRA